MTNASDLLNESGASERRSKLLGTKLAALVSGHLGHDVAAPTTGFPNGAAIIDGRTAWVLVDGEASRSLGGALSWAVRQSATSLNLVADSDAGLLARRSERLTIPTTVWRSEQRSLLPVIAEPLAELPTPSSTHLNLISVIEEAGASPRVEHGVVFGEVRGLEVCRVVDEPTVGLLSALGDVDPDPGTIRLDAGNAGDQSGGEFEGVQLEVGVGANDREAFRLLHGGFPTVESLRGVVETVEKHRTSGAAPHPLNRLGRERFIRWRLEQEPGLINLSRVAPAEPPVARRNLKDAVPCVARASANGKPVMLVCSAGIDLDLIPFVADVQAMYDDPVIMVLPERDLVPITVDLAALLTSSVEIRSIG